VGEGGGEEWKARNALGTDRAKVVEEFLFFSEAGRERNHGALSSKLSAWHERKNKA